MSETNQVDQPNAPANRRSSACSLARVFWRMLHPFTIASHKCFGLSYKWVNVTKAAWHPEWFDPLWHHRWFGDPIEEMPSEIVLCGIRYRVSVREGLVWFVDYDMRSTKFGFERDPHDKYSMMWYLTNATHAPASHIEDAYHWVKAVYGKSHEFRAKPI